MLDSLRQILNTLRAKPTIWVNNSSLKNTAEALVQDYKNEDANVLAESEAYTDKAISEIIFPIVPANTLKISIVAQENILAFQPVTADGHVADSGNNAYRDRVVGLALANINNTFSGDVIANGKITNSAWSWATKVPIYINGIGLLSPTPPTSGWSQIIGISYSSDTINVQINTAYLL